jgi:serine phosphatase RsbU (regulator of sigma subunit)
MMNEEDELHCISGTLSSNDSLYIYSDGLIEAENSVGKFLGQAGFEQLLELSIMKKQDSLPAIKIGLTNYVGSTPPTDDISLVQIQGSASL